VKLLKLVVSIAFIAFVLTKVNFGALHDVLRDVHWLFIFLTFLITIPLILVSVIKWQLLLRTLQIELDLIRAFRLYLLGYSFNQLLPSNVGGDVVRAIALGRRTSTMAESLVSVFMERFTGMTVLVILAAVACGQLWLNHSIVDHLALGVTVLGISAWGLLLAIGIGNLTPLVGSLLPVKRFPKLQYSLQSVHVALSRYRNERDIWVRALSLSLVFYVLTVVNVLLAVWSFRGDVKITDLFIIVPLILVTSMIPITLGGIGLSEWAYVYFFEVLGYSAELALAVALLIRTKAIIFGLPGLLVHQWSPKQTTATVTKANSPSG
jgi:uncharacterized protein (TIRG00374 family)